MRRLLISVLALFLAPAALQAQWTVIDGDAADVAVGADGTVWVVNTDRRQGGGLVLRWTDPGWENRKAVGSAVAVDPDGYPWFIADRNRIYRWTGTRWQRVDGMANDIAVGADGTVWAINVDRKRSMDAPMRWTGSEWEHMGGQATSIAVGPDGIAWIITAGNIIYRWMGTDWEPVPGEARDIAIGPDGTVVIVGMEEVLDGWQLKRYTGSGWEPVDGGARRVALGPDGDLWIAINDGRIRHRSLDAGLVAAADSTGPRELTVDGGFVIGDAVETRSFMYGFVDMHTHPMAHLAFGSELFHGGVDGDPIHALGACRCYHRGWNRFENSCGNVYREALVNEIDIRGHETGDRAGYPVFSSYPRHDAILHQQMYVDWIRRARDGGLRTIVALAVNSHTLADAAETAGPNDDLASMNLQIRELRAFVDRHDFMEIAYTPADMRRIVEAGNLAVIMGAEMDNIGNFYDPADRKDARYVPNPTDEQIAAEIDRLYGEGIRYIFPIHVTNNAFGGAAIYESGFNVANKYNTGRPFAPESVDARDTFITFKLQSPYLATDWTAKAAMAFTGTIVPGQIMPDRAGNYPSYPDPGPHHGHRNSQGLTDRGRFAIQYMMGKGMMIDIDHMSERAVTEVLNMAIRLDVPVNSGHNNLRRGEGNENLRTAYQYIAIRDVGGMVGVGHMGEATLFLEQLNLTLYAMKGGQVAIGTDANGMFPLPGPPASRARVTYDRNLTPSVMGTKTFDYNRDGFAHYGLFPDFIQSLRNAGMHENVETAFFHSAEYFARMWEKVNRRAASVRGAIAGGQGAGGQRNQANAGDESAAEAMQRLLEAQAAQRNQDRP